MADVVSKVVRSEGFFHGRLLEAYERGRAVIDQSLLGEQLIFPLFGSAGVGKTETIAAWVADYPQQQNAQGKIIKPVIRVTCPVEPNQRSMALSIIRGLQGRVLSRSNTADLVEQALMQLKIAEVNTVIFDEVQHLAENLSAAHMKKAVNFLQFILDQRKHSFILVGLPTAQRFLTVDPSFQRRCLATELVYPYAWISTAHRQDFAAGVALIAEAYREQG